jgi:hypothetical protein
MTAPSGITRKKRWRCRQQALGKDGAAVCNNRLEKKDGAAGAADKNHIKRALSPCVSKGGAGFRTRKY